MTREGTGKPKLEFGSSSGQTLTGSLTLTNVSDQAVTYNVSQIALTDYHLPANGYTFNVYTSNEVASTLNSASTVTVEAHSSVDLPVSISFDGVKPNQFVEGFVNFESADKSAVSLTVPFLSFYGDWDSLKVFDELRWNLLDGTIENDPTFTLTTLVNPTSDNYYFINSEAKIWMNPGNPDDQHLGTGKVGMLATMLRNAEEVNFRVLDENGEVVREIGQHTSVRKIVRLSRSAPYTFFDKGVWNGTLDGEPVKDGEKYTYQVEVLRTKESTPQVLNFELNIDNTLPTIENVAYDSETYTLSFDAKDDGSGLVSFDLINYFNPAKRMVGGTGAGEYPELMAKEGVVHYEVNIKSILEADSPSYIFLLANDKAGNVAMDLFVADQLNDVDILAGAPVVEQVTNKDTTVKGSTTKGYQVKVSVGDQLLGETTAAEDGNFSVDIPVQEEGTVLSVTSTNPLNNHESPARKVLVVATDLVVNVEVIVDGKPLYGSTMDLSSTEFTLNGKPGEMTKTNPVVVTFNEMTTGSYPMSVSGLPEGLYPADNESLEVNSNTAQATLKYHLTTTKPVTPQEPDKEEGPYGQGHIRIETPELLEAYNESDIAFKGQAWGYPLITELVVNGEHNLSLTKHAKTAVTDASGAEVFFGNVFTFNDQLTLGDDYYEMPFMIRSSDDVTAQTVRRFWVDTENPSIEATVLERDSNSETALIQVNTSDNMSILVVHRGDDFINTHDWTSRGFNTRNVTGSDTDLVKLVDGLNTIEYTVTDIAGNTQTTEVQVMKADKSVLNALLRFVGLMEDRHEALEEAYQAGLLVSANPMATQEEIDAAVEALYAAQASLKEAPVISGHADKVVYVGESVDLLAGVTAMDEQDGDLTDQLVVTPESVDTSVVGETVVTYTVTDSTGNTATETITVTVIEKPVVEVNKAALRMALAIAQDTLASETLPEAFRARLEAAVQAGQQVLDNPDATQEEVDAAAQAIRVALDPNSPVNQGPTLSGVRDVEVERNTKEAVDVLAGVSAHDAQDGDLTSQITASPMTIDTKTLGETVVTYTVMDSDGNVSTATATFTVVKKVEVPKADTKALKDALKEAEKFDTTGYPDELVKELEDAMAHAQAVLDSKDPSQELVDMALARLMAALDAVKAYEKPVVETPKPGKDPKPGKEPKPGKDPKPGPGSPSENEVTLVSGDVSVTGKLEDGVTLSVTKLNKQIKGYTGVVYEIKLLKDGQVVQPTSPVTVSIKTSDKDAKVYYVEGNKVTLVDSSNEKGAVTFTTDHFSEWLVGKEAASTQTTKPSKGGLPNTGTESMIMFTGIGTVLVAGGMYLVLKKKKEA